MYISKYGLLCFFAVVVCLKNKAARTFKYSIKDDTIQEAKYPSGYKIDDWDENDRDESMCQSKGEAA